ncbi:MAG: HU family DNA-binding protein [Anaerolineales bacterium]|nr:HU family DNA-binding protein [Anaerolineales bacterium]
MAVQYTIVPKRNPQDLEAPPKYYPILKSRGRADFRRLAERISYISTVSSADALATLEALLTVIPQELAQGYIVELGELGALRLTASVKGAHEQVEVNASFIQRVNVKFKPGRLFREALKKLEFTRNKS